jgi:ASC-1-like (ASCH) protein
MITPTTHELKSWPEYFQSTLTGRKTFELRKFDRDFKVGDKIILREYNPDTGRYTSREDVKIISYVLANGPWLQPGFCALGIKD